MHSGNERSGAGPRTGTTSSTWERQEQNGELSSLDRLELLGWDEV
jgi:hypothetical protein